jgi:hypothetical protein
MSFQRGIDGSEPIRSEPVGGLAGPREQRRVTRGSLGTGTLACPRCDAPVVLAGDRVSPMDRVGCPFCHHAAPARDFLSLTQPARPARVEVRVVQRT